MPVLGNYVGFERYVAYGGIAGWCRKAGRDAWDRYHREQAPWFRKKEPEMSNREKWETTTSNSRSGRGRDAWPRWKEEAMGQPHDPTGLYLVLICDPYEEPSYDDICYVCDGDHLDGFVGRLHDAGFSPEDIHVLRCAVNERIDWDGMDRRDA